MTCELALVECCAMSGPTSSTAVRSSRRRRVALAAVLLLVAAAALAAALAMAHALPPTGVAVQRHVRIASTDRLLVVSPHPDDESIACAGLIQQSLAAGAQVRVLWMTAGDHNVVGPPLLWRKAAVVPAQFRAIGRRRMQEAKAAAAVLGLQPSDLIFLGYPDGGLSSIFMKAWTSEPYRSGLTNAANVPYAESPVVGQPQTATNLLTDVEQVMSSFRPTIVAYPNFIDAHPDHQATGLFVTAALADLHMKPLCLEYLVHVKGWPRPLRYAPLASDYAPTAVAALGLAQVVVELTPDQVAVKARAIKAHASELLPLATLIAFARRTELFLLPAGLNQSEDPARAARFFFPLNQSGNEERTVVQRFSARQTHEGLQLSLDCGRPLTRLESLDLFIFPLPVAGTFGSVPKLHIVYRGGSTAAEVSDLAHPEIPSVRLAVVPSGTSLSLTLDRGMTGGMAQGVFVRIEKGTSDIDLARSRTVWISLKPAM